MAEDCSYLCKARDEINSMKIEIRNVQESAKANAFFPWMRGLIIALFGSLFFLLYTMNVSVSKEYIPRAEVREYLSEMKADNKEEFMKLNAKIDRLLSEKGKQ